MGSKTTKQIHQELVSNPMADNSLDNLHNKDSPVSGPTNHKADIIKDRLHELKIAYQILTQCEHCRDRFTNAVKMGTNPREQQKN